MACSNRKYPQLRSLLAAFFGLSFFYYGCSVKKTLTPGSYLLKKNTVSLIVVPKKQLINDTGKWDAEKNKKAKTIKKKSKITNGEVMAQILHRANKRVVFNKLPMYLWLYNFGTSRKNPSLSDSTPWRRKLRNLGEPPVILDSSLIQLSADNIHNYLFNKGFFDAKVEISVKYKRHKAKVKYIVSPGRAYLINSFFIRCEDSALMPLLSKFTSESDYFRLWWPVNMNLLNEARSKLAVDMRNLGYYTLKAENFRFEADTLQNKKEAKLTLVLENPALERSYVKYHFDRVMVNIETSPVYERTHNQVTANYPGITINLNRYPLNPNLITKLVYIDSGNFFSQSSIDKTYQSLVQMGLFSIVDLRLFSDTAHHLIRTEIDLKTMPRMVFSVEPQGLYSPNGSSGLNFQSTSQRSFGGAFIVSFTNRNVARNAENFRLSSTTSYEGIIKKDNNNSLGKAFQQGFNASLSLPHFRLFKNRPAANFQQRNTVLSLSYLYENNPNFFRSSIPASLTFQYVKPKISWYYTPTEISFNRNILSPGFVAKLAPTELAFIQRAFTNQFVSAAKVGLIYANNRSKPGETYIFTRAGFETSGNLHRFVRKLMDNNYTPGTIYTLFGLQYFQYSKIEGELRLRRSFDELNSAVFRVHSGVVVPYGNSTVVPYDKRYFVGGSTSVRAWRPRRLGPGSTPDTSSLIIDRSGEFLFEANLEYRFNLIRHFLESALFLDAGNIWNLNRKNQSADKSTILLNENFFDEMALNTGIGFRFDFKIFLFRIDWGIPLHDPGKKLGERWLLNKSSLTDPWGFTRKETALAVGIGYPF